MDSTTATPQKRKAVKQQQQQQQLWDKQEAKEQLQRLKDLLLKPQPTQQTEIQQIRQEFKNGKHYLQRLSSIYSQSKQLDKSKKDLLDTLQKLRQHHKFLQRQKELEPPLYLRNPFLMGGGGVSVSLPSSPALSLRGVLEGSPYHSSMGGIGVSVPAPTSTSSSSTTTTTHRYGTRRNSGGGSGPSGVPLQDIFKAITKGVEQQVLKKEKK
jgi:hypothetical protein